MSRYIENFKPSIGDKTYKQIDSEFQVAYKEWKTIINDLYNVNYDMLFIYKDTCEYEMLNRYDYKYLKNNF